MSEKRQLDEETQELIQEVGSFLVVDGFERRQIATELRADPDGVIEGYAAVFGQQSEDLGGFREVIRKGAFSKTVKEADVRATFNHDPNFVLGRRKSGTLDIKEDKTGLFFRVHPPETAWASDLRVSVQRGDIDQASFQFRTLRDDWRTKDGQTTRELIEVSLSDVSIVTYPAYPQTSVSARSLAEMFISQVRGQVDPELVGYMRTQLDQIEAAAAPENVLHPADPGDQERAEQVRVRLALLKRRLQLETLR